MNLAKLYIDNIETPFITCNYSDYVAQIGDFAAELNGIQVIEGLTTVRIEEDGETVFQGLVETPDKKYSKEGQRTPISGPEWTARLLHHYCPQNTTINGENLSSALTTILTNSPFGLGTVDDFSIALNPTVFDSALEILPFTFTNSCIVYSTTEELHDELAAGTFEMPSPNRRSSFYSKTSGYFYVIAYDNDNSLLKYNSTNDGETWKGWTSLGFNAGDNGNFGICWDETNGRLFLLADDGANIDYYRYSEAGGTLTQQDTDANVCAGDLICMALDDEGDLFMIVEDAGEADYELWQFDYSTSTWAEEDDWTIASTDVPKYLFQGANCGYDTGDMIIIGYDTVNDDLEEWYWDESGGAINFSNTDIINDTVMTGDNGIGYVSGFQDAYGNIFVIVEELVAAGGAYLTFSYRYADDLNDYQTWALVETVIDVADYQTTGNFSLGGDYADNLYLWYQNEASGGTAELYLARRYEGTWETEVDTGYDCKDGSGIQAPHCGLAQYSFHLDTGDDVHFILLTPYGVCTTRQFDFPYFAEDHDTSNNYTGSYENAGSCTQTATDTSTPYSGTKNLKVTIPANWNNMYSIWYKEVGTEGTFGDHMFISAKKVKWNRELDTNGEGFMLLRCGDGVSSFTLGGVGVYRNAGVDYWAFFRYQVGVGTTWDVSAVPAVHNTEYNIELMIYRDGANGYLKLYVDGVETHTDTGLNNDSSSYDTDYANFGLAYADAPASGTLEVVMDDCRISQRRIDEGSEVTGVYQTTVHTLSGSNWGTLTSTDVDIYNLSWDVEDDVGVDIVTGLALPVNLDTEGVPSTETDIVIEANFTQKGENTSFVKDISIGEEGTILSSYHDAENTYRGIEKISEQLDAEYKLGYDDLVDFVDELGEDKTADVELFTSRSQSLFPDKEPTLLIVERNPDWGYYANCILVIGGTPEGESRVYATAKDTDEIATMSERLGGQHNGEVWYVVRDPELLTASGCQNRANTEKTVRVGIYERISGTVKNTSIIDGVVRGDTITVHDRNTDVDHSARILGLHVSYDGKGNKTVSLDLLKVARSSSLNRHVGSINDLKRYATA